MTDLPSDVTIRVAHARLETPVRSECLSTEERARLDAYRHHRRKATFALGRETVRGLLGERLELDPLAVPLRSAADGALDVGVGGLFASLAHTVSGPVGRGGEAESEIVVAAAVAPRPVGVDVEAFKRRRNDLYRRILHPAEYRLLDLLGEPHPRAQIILWAIKEAALKANRTGLRVAMRSVGVDLEPAARAATCHIPEATSLTVRYEVASDYALAVAFEG